MRWPRPGLALAVGVRAPVVAAGLRTFTPGGHRNVLVAEHAGVRYFDDSKATNPHAALASLQAYGRVVWIAGGQLKGAAVDDLVRRGRRPVGRCGVARGRCADRARPHFPDTRRMSLSSWCLARTMT